MLSTHKDWGVPGIDFFLPSATLWLGVSKRQPLPIKGEQSHPSLLRIHGWFCLQVVRRLTALARAPTLLKVCWPFTENIHQPWLLYRCCVCWDTHSSHSHTLQIHPQRELHSAPLPEPLKTDCCDRGWIKVFQLCLPMFAEFTALNHVLGIISLSP